MNRRRRVVGLFLIMGGCLLLHAAWAASQTPVYPPPGPRPAPSPGQGKPPPRMEPFAETKLLMEGLAQSNFKGLEKILTQKPQDNQSWVFARGQALLLAETGNLLMLRPPRNEGEQVWFQRAGDFRAAAVQLAASVGQKDFDRSRAALHGVANSCNRCHQTFRVPVQVKAFAAPLKVNH